ncbi:MAG TPA: hypothetical protein VMF59_01780 [Bacteroidota bacterium]|nr:hypothetical protein [Bacteroidota bacterium]
MVSGSVSYRQIAPDILQVQEDGGCLSLFGVPFLVVGIFVTLVGIRVFPMQNAADIPIWG